MREKLNLVPKAGGKVWLADQLPARLKPHSHDELEFNLVLHGTGHYLLHGKRYELQKGSLVWLFPGQPHVLTNASTGFQMWVAVFKIDLIRYFCRLVPAAAVLSESHPKGTFCRLLSLRRAEVLGEACQAFDAVTAPPLYRSGLLWLLRHAWQAWDHANVEVLYENIHPAIEKTVRLLREDPSLTLPTLAGKAGISPSYLSRRFQRDTGMSLSAFRNQCRLQCYAVLRGADTRRTILDCALAAGFGSYEQFRRVYKKNMHQLL